MILPIDKNYRIAGTPYAWTIEKSRSKKGKKQWEAIKWYGTLDGAVKSLASLMVRTSEARTLAEALEEVETVSTRLCQALTPLNDTGETSL